MDLGKNIYNFRVLRGFSQEALAAKVNVSRQTIYKWENNIAVPRADHIMRLVEIYKISYDDLFSENTDNLCKADY